MSCPARVRSVDKMNTKLPNFGGTQGGGNDSKYFQTTKKGAQLRLSLAQPGARSDAAPTCRRDP